MQVLCLHCSGIGTPCGLSLVAPTTSIIFVVTKKEEKKEDFFAEQNTSFVMIKVCLP